MPDPDWARRRQGYWQFRDYHGRLFDLGEESFMLPADGEESNRLEAQHHMLKLALGGLYITPEDVERALAPREGRAPAVLDIGTGNGTWAIEMAKRFPHCEVIGMDLAPPQPLQDVPVNCKFEIEDANFPMLHYANTFDVVHCRLVDGGIRDYPKFLNEIARILRPGGVVLLGKGIHQLYLHPAENVWDPLPVVPEGHPRYTNCQTMFTAVWNAARKNGGSEFATLYYKFWLENNPNFGTPTPRDLYIPISPWIPGLTDKERYVCEMKREDMKELFKAFKPILKRDGYSDEQADKWIQGTRMELDRMTVHAYAKWIYCSAVRGNTPFQENVIYPPLPNYSFS